MKTEKPRAGNVIEIVFAAGLEVDEKIWKRECWQCRKWEYGNGCITITWEDGTRWQYREVESRPGQRRLHQRPPDRIVTVPHVPDLLTGLSMRAQYKHHYAALWDKGTKLHGGYVCDKILIDPYQADLKHPEVALETHFCVMDILPPDANTPATVTAEKTIMESAMLLHVAERCPELDKGKTKQPGHWNVFRLAWQGLNSYQIHRDCPRWKRKTIENRIEKIEKDLLDGKRISSFLYNPDMFREVERQRKAGQKHGVSIHGKALLGETEGEE